MLQFKKLKLTGFKSFVDNTELLIELGLTGIVGPNGCGKSNLVEALKWAMGETSAKQMRGDEMEDIIFGGTETRPPRNIAEVVLSLDNSERSAPPNFNGTDELEVSRRIEREKGSTYRLNGKEVRAKDVQLLFADSATGARSTALVSQGRVASVINAKPIQRRSLLEEAAGITGLHARRHEAQLRLRAAETNIERLDDILITFKDQLQNLKNQSRQASRYRNLSDYIQKAESSLFYLLWSSATTKAEEKKLVLIQAEEIVKKLTIKTARQTNSHEKNTSVLPELRSDETKVTSELQSLNVANKSLEDEIVRIKEAKNAAELRLTQLNEDMQREANLSKDAEDAVSKLENEQKKIETAINQKEHNKNIVTNNLKTANKNVQKTDRLVNQLMEKITKNESLLSGLNNRRQYLLDQKERFINRVIEIEKAQLSLSKNTPDKKRIETLTNLLRKTEIDAQETKAILEKIQNKITSSENEKLNAITSSQDANTEFTKLQAEETALKRLLNIPEETSWPPVIDTISVEPGYELALGTALGDDLSVPENENAPIFWRKLPPLGNNLELPKGTQKLSDFVRGPDTLIRRLTQIGVVHNDSEGWETSRHLLQGQRLVSFNGSLWRWDGYTITSAASTAASIKLDQRNRLKQISSQSLEAKENLKQTETALSSAQKKERDLRNTEEGSRNKISKQEEIINETRNALVTAKNEADNHIMEMNRLHEALKTNQTEILEIDQALDHIGIEIDNLPNSDLERVELDQIRETLVAHRTKQLTSQSDYDVLEREASERKSQLNNVINEIDAWKQREVSSKMQLSLLSNRCTVLKTELNELKSKPKELVKKQASLLAEIDKLEKLRNIASAVLIEAENRLRDSEQSLRNLEKDLADSRENMIRSEEALSQSNQDIQSIASRAREKLNCRPQDLFQLSGLKEGAALPELDITERKIERLIKERETMGPVNLRADHEADEISQKIGSLIDERDELVKAIEKLRQGINKLNKEGRERLLRSYKEVDQNFQKIFIKLFGGGRAHLKMTDSDDPLESGLEIMASPPGKKLQILSLLSGGEQALTALSLLFAVFLTNPAPICVLDEVDAPLDDANVDRFCKMLDEMALNERTRFLIITHHRLTMAKMDRLFGITMSERGVSKLVSVDLQEADEMKDSS